MPLKTNAGYQEFLDYCDECGLINSQGIMIGVTTAGQQNLKKEWLIANDTLRELTKALPKKTSNALRIRCVRNDILDLEALCPVCQKMKIWSSGPKGRFRLTCGLGDREHKDYIQNYKVTVSFAEFGGNPMKDKDTVVKAQQTQKDRNGGVLAFNRPEVIEKTRGITQERFVEYREIKEAGGPGYNPDLPKLGRGVDINYDNYILIDRKYLIEHFVSAEGIGLHDKLCKFLNCTVGLTYKLFDLYEVNLEFGGAGFDQSKPAILYYFQDTLTGYYKSGITNRTVKARFSELRYQRRISLLSIEYFENGYEAKRKEKEILKKFVEFRVTNKSWFKNNSESNGAQEFFSIDILKRDNLLLPAP